MASLEDLQKENQNLKLAVEELSLLNEIAIAIGSSTEVEKINDLIVKKCVKKLRAQQGSIVLITEDEAHHTQTIVRKYGSEAEKIPARLGLELTGWIEKYQKPLLINDLSSDSRFSGIHKTQIKSLISAPLKLKNKLIGILTLFNKKDEAEFSPEDLRLISIIAAQAAPLIENARLHKEEEILKQDLLAAQRIQIGLLPKENPKIPGFDIFGLSFPAKEVGGDYFDFIKLSENSLGIAIADVSGKGLPAAILMSSMVATLRTQAKIQPDAAETVAQTNRLLCQLIEKGQFITMFYAILDTKNEVLTYTNAGHNPPILFRKDGTLHKLTEGGLVIGMMDNLDYPQTSLTLSEGDILVFYTDGITEASNIEEIQFDEERLKEVVSANKEHPSDQISSKICETVKNFIQNQVQQDDCTLIVIKVTR